MAIHTTIVRAGGCVPIRKRGVVAVHRLGHNNHQVVSSVIGERTIQRNVKPALGSRIWNVCTIIDQRKIVGRGPIGGTRDCRAGGMSHIYFQSSIYITACGCTSVIIRDVGNKTSALNF